MKGVSALLAAEMLLIRGKLNGRRKKYAKALQCYREALERYRKVSELSTSEANALAQIGWCLAAMGHRQDALDAYDQALQINPDFLIVHAHLSSVLEKLGDTKTASEYLERALRNSPELKNPQRAAYGHRQLGYMYFKLGDWTRAVESLRSAVKQKPDTYVYCNLAVALWHTGDKEGCVDAYTKAATLAPNDAELITVWAGRFTTSTDTRKPLRHYSNRLKSTEVMQTPITILAWRWENWGERKKD